MAGQQTLQLSVRGLHTFNSELSGVPNGALLRADNVNINRLNLIEPRRGFNFYDNDLASGERAYTLFEYDDALWTHTSAKLYADIAGWQNRGNLSSPDGARLRFATANDNLYVTTSNGIYKTDSKNTSLSLAGVQSAIDFSVSLTGTSGFLPDTYYVAYRVVFGRKDANNNLILGGASQRVQTRNNVGGGATRNAQLIVQIPTGIVVGDFLQVYRTESSATEPDEEYKLCYEQILSSTSAVTFTDNVIDDLLGAFLYVSNSQGGIANQHIALPFAKDICAYKGHLFAANVRYRHFFNLTLTSVGTSGTNTFQNNDTIKFTRSATIITYTGVTGTPGANQFKVYTSGTTAENIRDTALALVALVNSDSSNFLYATYLSGYNDLPGKVLFEARDLTNTTFSVVSSRGGAFSPTLPSSGTNSVNESTADEYKNGLAYSEQYEPEHWTDSNFEEVGDRNKAILRIIPLRDAIIILKEDGVYSLRGADKFDFSVTEIDKTSILLAPECVCTANNTAYAYTTTGFAAITDSGATIKSMPIKDQLLAIQGPAKQQIIDYSHAVAYDSEGKVFFFLPQNASSTYADIAFVFDIYNESFVRWLMPAVGAYVYDDRLHLGSATSEKILTERKELTYTDFSDYGGELTIDTDSGYSLVLSDASGISVGDILQQGELYAYVTAVSAETNTVTLDLDVDWNTGSPVTWLKAIPVAIEWNPEFAGNPAGYKQWSECLVMLKRGFLGDATAYFYTDIYTGRTEVTISQAAGSGNFGDFDFGSATFGGDPNKTPPRLGIPRNAAKSNLLFVGIEHNVAWSDFQLNGISLVFRPISTRSS
jgi:hypothetical protein